MAEWSVTGTERDVLLAIKLYLPGATGSRFAAGRWPGCHWTRGTTTRPGSGATWWPLWTGPAPRPGRPAARAARGASNRTEAVARARELNLIP
jgi:hypothetical protein